MSRGQAIVALRKDGGEFPVEISLSPVPTERGMLFYAIIRDISPQVAGPGVDRECYSGAVEKSGLLSSIEKEKEQDA